MLTSPPYFKSELLPNIVNAQLKTGEGNGKRVEEVKEEGKKESKDEKKRKSKDEKLFTTGEKTSGRQYIFKHVKFASVSLVFFSPLFPCKILLLILKVLAILASLLINLHPLVFLQMLHSGLQIEFV